MRVRFDDTRPGRARHLVFGAPDEVLEARRPSDVAAVITDAEHRARHGKWVAGFVTYEAAAGLDPDLATHPGIAGLPAAWFGVFDAAPGNAGLPAADASALGPWRTDTGEHEQARAVEAIREHIAAGDTYQVNYTTRLRSTFAGDAPAAYRALIDNQRGAFGAYLDIGSHLVLSASPELLFSWESGALTVRPMKGTIRRGRWTAEDDALRERLIASVKDRAENLMIVDLLRNDLGRVAEFGSVSVPSLFDAERFDTVWQLTSTVTARARSEVTLLDVFRAVFPSGSVTGAPKVRTMQIIRDLEPTPRGVYCGAIGMLAPDGPGEMRAVFNVAIRTVTIDRATGEAAYGIGGGITWDSDPADEYREAMLKAAVLMPRRDVTGLLETMRWEPDAGVLRMERHLNRLGDSARYFGFTFDPAAARAALAGVSGTGPSRVRLTLDPGGEITVTVSPAPDPATTARLVVDDATVDPTDVLLFHKTTNRDVYEAAAARHPGADDVVLVNRDGLATETTVGNLAVFLDGAWVTPPLADGCLPGVYREELLEEGRLVERSVPADRLGAAGGLAVLNSLRGWRRAVLEPRADRPGR